MRSFWKIHFINPPEDKGRLFLLAELLVSFFSAMFISSFSFEDLLIFVIKG